MEGEEGGGMTGGGRRLDGKGGCRCAVCHICLMPYAVGDSAAGAAMRPAPSPPPSPLPLGMMPVERGPCR